MIIYRLDGKVAKERKWDILVGNMNELNVIRRFFYIVLTSTLLSLGKIHMTARKLKRSYLTHLGRKCLGN